MDLAAIFEVVFEVISGAIRGAHAGAHEPASKMQAGEFRGDRLREHFRDGSVQRLKTIPPHQSRAVGTTTWRLPYIRASME
jgi:hypothetical protein